MNKTFSDDSFASLKQKRTPFMTQMEIHWWPLQEPTQSNKQLRDPGSHGNHALPTETELLPEMTPGLSKAQQTLDKNWDKFSSAGQKGARHHTAKART